MHELSLCRAIAETVVEHADHRRVSHIRLRVGHFRQVVPHALDQCWAMTAPAYGLADAELNVDWIPAVGRCRACDHATTLSVPVLKCAACGSIAVDLVSGEEFMVSSIDVAPTTASDHDNHAVGESNG